MHFSISTWLFTSLVHTFNSFRSALYLIASRVFTLEAEPVTGWVQKPRVVVGAFQAGVQSEIKPSIQLDSTKKRASRASALRAVGVQLVVDF